MTLPGCSRRLGQGHRRGVQSRTGRVRGTLRHVRVEGPYLVVPRADRVQEEQIRQAGQACKVSISNPGNEYTGQGKGK